MQKQDRIHFGIGAVAIPIAIGGFVVLDSHPQIAMILFSIAGIAFIWGIWPLLFRKRHKKPLLRKVMKQKPLPMINYEKIDSVTPQDKNLIESMGIRMMVIHGHMDLTGLLSDRASGVPLNELMSKVCSLCGTPRNKRGGKHG